MKDMMHHRRNKLQRAAGFTLVEVLIVVLIVGIAAGLALPMMSDTSRTRLREAADLLIADMAYAQIESISHGDNPRLMVFDTTNDGYFIAASSDATTPITNPMGNLPYRVIWGESTTVYLSGVTIDTLSVGGDDQLGFGIYGQLDQAANAVITLACEGNKLDLTLDSVNGEVTVGAIYTD